MSYIGQFDGLRRPQDAGRAIRNMRTMVVFSDGFVVCATGIDGGYSLPAISGVDALLRAALLMARPVAQLLVRGKRADQIRAAAQAMGQDGTADAFAKSRRKALAIPFSQVRMIEFHYTRQGRQLTVHTIPPGAPRELLYRYLGDVSADQLRNLLKPLVGSRLKIDATA